MIIAALVPNCDSPVANYCGTLSFSEQNFLKLLEIMFDFIHERSQSQAEIWDSSPNKLFSILENTQNACRKQK